jgi:hypothetical protein
MEIQIRKHFSSYGGIAMGALYGLIMRVIFHDFKNQIEFTDLFSITFIWIVPIVIGTIPMMFATREQLKSILYRVTRPVLTVFLFFILALWSGHEDIICVIIIAFPFAIAAAIGGLFFGKFLVNRKGNKMMMFSFLIIPFISGIVEEQFSTPSEKYQVINSVVINSTSENIWKNVVRVRNIEASEYEQGLFNYAGIPRPLYAELSNDTVGAIRIGHFEGGLKFEETVTSWSKEEFVEFDIKVVPSTIRSTVFDQHILQGQHFNFVTASYQLERLNAEQIKLTLSCTYLLNTKINGYSAFWAQTLLSDFQSRLLDVIKVRCTNSQKVTKSEQ